MIVRLSEQENIYEPRIKIVGNASCIIASGMNSKFENKGWVKISKAQGQRKLNDDAHLDSNSTCLIWT